MRSSGKACYDAGRADQSAFARPGPDVGRDLWAEGTVVVEEVAGGAEISWPTDSPPEGLSYQLNFALGSPDAC